MNDELKNALQIVLESATFRGEQWLQYSVGGYLNLDEFEESSWEEARDIGDRTLDAVLTVQAALDAGKLGA